ncbi:MAG: ATP-binding cassette domain-containing protein [Saprospiraceae bacterium]|nr:ATP-binding cassette domain-containing protein [Candidatus Vicinibacter affinis]
MSYFLVQAQRLNLTYGEHVLFKDLQFEQQEKEWVELIGGNGSGKSALIHAFYGLLPVQSGILKVLDYSLNPATPDFAAARRRIGIFSTKVPLIEDKTLRANLAIALNAADKIRDLNSDQYITDTLAKFGLAEKTLEKVSSLSSGEKVLLGLARAIIHRPRLLLLDNPFALLDESSIKLVKALLTDLHQKEGTGVLLTGLNLSPYSPDNRKVYQITGKGLELV